LALIAAASSLLLCPGPAQAQRPLGIDVSHYQGSITWSSVKNAGISFAWSKATEGTGYVDPYFTGNQNDGKAAGVYMGAYHFAHPESDTASSEAAYFWSIAGPYIKGDGKSMMPMLDMEGGAFSGHVGASSLSDWVNQWSIAVSNYAAAAGLVIKPMLYVSACNASHFDSSVAPRIPWIADYNGEDPQTGTPWSTCSSYNVWGGWTVWQYTSSGSISGISGNVDHDVFHGTASGLVSTLVIPIPGDGATFVSSSVPTVLSLGQSFTATIKMSNSGGTSWTNTGPTPYQLGSQSPQNNTTWVTNRISLPSSPINPGASANFSLTTTAPATAGTYTFAWRMVRDTNWFGPTFTTNIAVGLNNATVVSGSAPSTVITGQTFTATITLNNNGGSVWTNGGAKPYHLGSQSAQDNVLWGFNRVALPAASVNPGQNAAFTFTATAPMTPGTYTFAWKMQQDPTNWFGSAFSTPISVFTPGPGTNYGNYTIDWIGDSTARDGSYVALSSCSHNAWYSYVCNTAGTYFDRDIRWLPPLPAYGFSGRGYWNITALIPGSDNSALAKFTALNAAGADLAGPLTGSVNECGIGCTWPTVASGAVTLTNFGGFRSNTKDDLAAPSGGCNTTCGSFPVAYSQMHLQAARWHYLDDWVCLGSYASTNVNDLQNRGFIEGGLFLYPSLDTSHGNAIGALMGLNGRTPGRVLTGDCNYTNTLNFDGSAETGGNADAFGHCDNCDAYGFAWLFSPSGSGTKLVIGSGDGNRVWVNGALVNNTNANRTFARDQDTSGTVTLPGGWTRLLFKVHNFTGNFQGTVSLRAATNTSLNEPAVNFVDLGGYYSYGLGYEQDAWYPAIIVTNVYGASAPSNGAALYGNDTNVVASGTSSTQGPVFYWRTMQYRWGYGLGNADSDYADVSGTPTSTSWSHTDSGVTGHRRFHFFAVSRSGRTSFQDNGKTGGSRFQDFGNYGRYYDIYVDNVPPQNPSFSSVAVAGMTQIDLAWSIPLDEGVNVAPGSTESAGAAGNQDSQNWYRVGDVGVQVYRYDSVISSPGPDGAWTTSTALSDTGLIPNTAYTYALEARDNNTGLRGDWNNATGPQDSTEVWTLSVPPGPGSVVPSAPNPPAGSNITWTAAAEFGPGAVQYYRFAWDTIPTHTWTNTEPQWSADTISTVPATAGNWYLHLKGYNGADVGNGSFDYAITATEPTAPCSQTNVLLGITANVNGTFTLNFLGTPQAAYYVVANTNLSATNWAALANSTNTVIDANGFWQVTVSNTALQQFYRSVAITPCP
jgi:GH25 family lysozyme M1 (1,4-beta-N-acetylmuramidase)